MCLGSQLKKGESKMSEILDFLSESKVFYLATVEGNKPKVRPFGLAFELDGKLYFATNETKPSYQQILNNPNVEISATNEKHEWVRISGEAVFDQRQVVKDKVFEVSPHLKDMYGKPDSPVLAPFYLKTGEAIFSSLSAPSRSVKF
jgi:uncharacterized pyridoxamine 5'-phosphate oxidase family protein